MFDFWCLDINVMHDYILVLKVMGLPISESIKTMSPRLMLNLRLCTIYGFISRNTSPRMMLYKLVKVWGINQHIMALMFIDIYFGKGCIIPIEFCWSHYGEYLYCLESTLLLCNHTQFIHEHHFSFIQVNHTSAMGWLCYSHKIFIL